MKKIIIAFLLLSGCSNVSSIFKSSDIPTQDIPQENFYPMYIHLKIQGEAPNGCFKRGDIFANEVELQFGDYPFAKFATITGYYSMENYDPDLYNRPDVYPIRWFSRL